MEEILTSQDAYVKARSLEFTTFLHELQLAIRKYVRVDDVQVRMKQHLVAPRQKVRDFKPATPPSPQRPGQEPVYSD